MVMRMSVLLALLSSLAVSQALITTVAGTDKTFPDAGVNGLQIALAPFGVGSLDTAGDFYFIDNNVNKVLKLAPNGVLSAVAGNGIRAFSGDGGPAIRASLNLPDAVAVDTKGNLFIADQANYRIRRVDAGTGIITTIAGSGGSTPTNGEDVPALNASFGAISGIAIDSANNIYISDYQYNVVRRISTAGTISTYLSSATPLSKPQGLAVDSANNLYVADEGNNVVRSRSLTGGITIVAGNGQPGYNGDGISATTASLWNPRGVAVDAAGSVYIADYINHRIRKVTGGIITTVAGSNSGGFSGETGPATATELSFPSSVSVDPVGNLFIMDSNNSRVRRVAAGTMSTVAGSSAVALLGQGVPASTALFSTPYGVAVDSQRNLYIADTGNHRIRKVASNGIVTNYAGTGSAGYSGDFGPATSASFNNPFAVAVDSLGNVYVADRNNSVIRKIQPSGTITTVAGIGACDYIGDGKATSTPLCGPEGIAMDAAGNIWIADTYNHLIRVVTNDGRLQTVAGVGSPGYFGDGGSSTVAGLSLPAGVALDPIGNVYVADTGNSAIRKIDTNGNISTLVGGGKLASLNQPMSVLADALGNVFFSDTGNSLVRVLSRSGVLSTVAGIGVDGFSGDGGPANQAAVSLSVSSLALDSANNLYIADPNNSRIREVLATAPTVGAAPSSLTFTAKAGDAPAPFQTVNLSSIAGVIYSVQASDPWIQVTPSSGLMPGVLQVTVDPGTLNSGTSQGKVIITASGGSPGTLTIPVSATITAAQPAALAVNTPGLRFGLVQGTGASQQQFQIKNSGGGSLSYTAKATTVSGGSSWLTITPAGGSVTAASPGTITVTASPQGLAPGTYTGAVAFTSSAGNSTVTVIMTVSAAQPRILLSQTGLSFQVLQGGIALPKGFAILNSGQGELSWTASVTTLSGGSGWMTLDANSGTVATPLTDVSTVSVSVNPSGLPPGAYYGQVLVMAPGADNAPQIVSVLLTVLPPGSMLSPEVRPASLIFTGSPGQNPGSQNITIANPTSQALTFTSSTTLADTFTNIAYLPRAGSLAAGGMTTITVQPDFSQQRSGVNTSTLGIQFSNGTLQTVKVLTVVPVGSGAGGTGNTRAAGSCSLTATPSDSQSPITAAPGTPITISVNVLNSCNSQAVTSGSLLLFVSFSNNDKVLQLTSAGGGKWAVSYTVRNPAPTIKATIVGGLDQGNANVVPLNPPLVLSIVSQTVSTAPPPAVSDGGVVNGASFEAGPSLVSPGSYVSIFGSNLGDPNQPQATSVTIGLQKLALQYVSNSQINAQVPFNGLPTGTDLPIVVQQGPAASNTTPVTIAAAHPAIFTANQTGSGQGAIVNAVSFALADANAPVGAGDIVSIFCTGLGQVDRTLNAGDVSPTPPANTVNKPAVTIGGQTATVLFSGLAPGFVGLYQVNAMVPKGLTPGAVPVTITIASQTTSSDKIVTMVVH